MSHHHQLKPLPPESLPNALELVHHYRLLNEPEEAESICLDILTVDPTNQEALTQLLLSYTDQLREGDIHALHQAQQLIPRLESVYARAYYGGLVCERQAKALLRQRGRRSGFVAHEWFHHALEEFGRAMELDESGTGDAVLRWNACVRMIERNPHCVPSPDDRVDYGIE